MTISEAVDGRAPDHLRQPLRRARRGVALVSVCDEAAIIVLDGRAETSNGLSRSGTGTEVDQLPRWTSRTRSASSTGRSRSSSASSPTRDEWKVMALASYAER